MLGGHQVDSHYDAHLGGSHYDVHLGGIHYGENCHSEVHVEVQSVGLGSCVLVLLHSGVPHCEGTMSREVATMASVAGPEVSVVTAGLGFAKEGLESQAEAVRV